MKVITRTTTGICLLSSTIVYGFQPVPPAMMMLGTLKESSKLLVKLREMPIRWNVE
jgi:hypothetical protein